MIEFRGVSKTFPDGTTAVENFSFVLPSHQTTVLVGSSRSFFDVQTDGSNPVYSPTRFDAGDFATPANSTFTGPTTVTLANTGTDPLTLTDSPARQGPDPRLDPCTSLSSTTTKPSGTP